MNQTAIEWLIENSHIIPKNELNKRELIKQVKEIEKQQIIDAWHDGYNNQSPMIDEENCGKQYYNEIFKNK